MSVIHPACSYYPGRLFELMNSAVGAGRVTKSVGPDGLSLFTYTRRVQYERSWDPVTLLARGIIFGPAGELVGLPFPKFFSYGEPGAPSIRLGGSFEASEKLDGSLISLFWHQGVWRCATKGSFVSNQARWAEAKLAEIPDLEQTLLPGTTYLFEATYAANRIVISYPEDRLCLLGGYFSGGSELETKSLDWFARQLGCGRPQVIEADSIEELAEKAKALPASHEGYVVRYASGTRVKLKGDSYLLAHRIVTGMTPLSIWEAQKNEAAEEYRKLLPEETCEDIRQAAAFLRLPDPTIAPERP